MRQTGIEPVLQPWKGCILPLNYWRGDSLVQAVIVSILLAFLLFYQDLQKSDKKDGLTETRTRVTGFKVRCTNQLYYKACGALCNNASGIGRELAVVSILILLLSIYGCNTMAYKDIVKNRYSDTGNRTRT